MITAAAERPTCPCVDEIEYQRRVDTYCRVQAHRRLPGTITYTGDTFTLDARHRKRNPLTAADYDVAVRYQARCLDLQAFQRGIDVTRGAAGDVLLAHDMPGFKGLAQFHCDAFVGDIAK